jgi:hypothetical protein
MRMRTWTLAALLVLSGAPAWATAQRITAADTALLFGGSDAEGGIGDWYLSNGVVEAIIDDVGVQSDLTGVLPPGEAPPIQSEIAITGGSLLDAGRVGADDDQLTQFLTVGGLSTSNFLRYDTITTPSPDTVRATGGVLFPPASVEPAPCLAVVTDYTAAGSDPFITVSSTATNNCGVAIDGFNGFLDVFIWTQRSIVPFSGGGAPGLGGRGFDHAALDLADPASALELPAFMAGPGTLAPDDGIVDTLAGTPCGEVAYGLLGLEVQRDPDGDGPMPADAPVAVNGLFGVNSALATALGNLPGGGGLAPGATLTYRRRLYVGAHNDVRSVADDMIAALAARQPFATGTLSGNVDAADAADVEATLLVTRLGQCTGNAAAACHTDADCAGGTGPCADPVPTPGFLPGQATTQIRTDATGAFSGVVLPQGRYEVRVSSPERDDVVVGPVDVGAGDTAVAVPPLSARGTFTFLVAERSRGVFPPVPAKLVLKGVPPTPDPRFNRDVTARLSGEDILAETFGGTQAGSSGSAAGQSNVVYTATGQGSIQVRPGTYDVYASRGLEYSVALRRVTVPVGGETSASFRLKRVIRTPDAVSADFHVHSGRSLDTNAALRDRVLAFGAEGVEVMVATDHDKHVDYAPLIAELGLERRLRSIVGDEVTGSVPNPPAFPNSFGHINGWPLPTAADAPRDGAIQDEFVAPNWLFKRLRDAGAEVIQYNHPRAGLSGITSIGIFNNIGCNRCANAIDTACAQDADCPAAPAPRECTCVGYQPDRPLTMPPNDILLDKGVRGPGTPDNPDGLDNLAFDVIELENGARASDVGAYRQVRRDWLSLLNQGVFRPATGVSDSHRITIEHAGWARTFVFGAGDDPQALDIAAFDRQVKAGDMLVTGGPYVELSARAKGSAPVGLGQMIPVVDGRVRLRIRVTSPAWIPVEEVRIIANGVQVAAFDATTRPKVRPVPKNFQKRGGTRRFAATVKMPVTQDTYFVVEAGAKLPADPNVPPASPPIMDAVVPGVVPIALTNPIFVDADANGRFDPPGLPVMAAAATPTGLWPRVRAGLAALAARWSGEVTADEGIPGTTGVTRADKAAAARKGEYFPLYEFRLPDDAVTRARAAEEAARRALERAREAAPAAPPPR